MKITPKQKAEFQKEVYTYYNNHKRDFPWRKTEDPYCIFVSEIMLQQTQTDRAVDKYREFIHAFPSFEELAQASFAEVLGKWKGLGYNRRAKWTHEISKIIVKDYDGKMPDSLKELEKLPGIGHATARSISAFAFDRPTVFLETNIRTVLIHHFFADKDKVDDEELLKISEQVLDEENPREWYSALMDYGVYLKKELGNLNHKSTHYRKQSKFIGSDRQIRGKILAILLKEKEISLKELIKILDENSERVLGIVDDLIKENLIKRDKTNELLRL